MDSERFDQIARRWATSSRRRVLGALAAGALTTLLPGRAGAACQEGEIIEGPCGTRECIAGEFVDFFEDAGTECRPAANECDAAEVCTGSSINCPVDRNRPNGSACSSDGNVCTDDVCQDGQCVHVPNTAACADDGNVCTNDICASGTCTHPARPNGTACADDGNVCTNDVCANGTCTHPAKPNGTSCPDGACCGDQCVDTKTDESHCGACDRVCGPGRRCCKGKCVNLTNDERNCGKCGKRCRRGQTCRRGRCR